MSKRCFKCGQTKPLEDFYKHPGMADGRLGKCKECTKKDSSANRAANIEKYRAYDRKRGNRQPPTYLSEYRKKNPEKARAHSLLNTAVARGKIAKGDTCEMCGSTFAIEAHHDDYSKPLEVRWLCSACHSQEHAAKAA